MGQRQSTRVYGTKTEHERVWDKIEHESVWDKDRARECMRGR